MHSLCLVHLTVYRVTVSSGLMLPSYRTYVCDSIAAGIAKFVPVAEPIDMRAIETFIRYGR